MKTFSAFKVWALRGGSRLLRLITLLMLVACSGAATSNSQPLKIAWGALWPGYFSIYIGIQQGFFEKQGVQVESVYFDTGASVFPEISADKVDGALMTLGDAVLLNEHLNLVSMIDYTNGADQILAVPEVKTLADIKGKRIGVNIGAFGELFVREMLKQNNILLSDVTLVNVQPEESAEALGKTVDVVYTFDPYAAELAAQGNQIIFTTAQTPGLIGDVIAFRKEVVQARPNDVRAFIAGWQEAVAWWQANPDAGNALIAAATKQDPTTLSTAGIKLLPPAINKTLMTQPSDPASAQAISELYVDFYIESGVLTQRPDLDEFINTTLLP